jgi:hypothetical protein
MIMEPDNPEKRRLYFEKMANLVRKSKLAMTADDHIRAGGTPPDVLLQNPGKTQAELLSDQEILEYLKDREKAIAECSLPGLTNELKKDLGLSKTYLREIGRLPQEYQVK